MYNVIPNFISDDEQKYIKSFLLNRVNELNGKLNSYSNFFPEHEYETPTINYVLIDKDIGVDKKLTEIVHRMQDAIQVSHDNPCTYFNWVISIGTTGTEVTPHVDPIDAKLIATKKIVRMNVIVQNAKHGGNFELLDKDTWVVADIPDKALMTFDASDIRHKISKNLSNTTRINLSIDAVVDRNL